MDSNAMSRRTQLFQMNPQDRLNTILNAKAVLANAAPEYQKEIGPILDEAHKRALQEQKENQPEAVGGSN